MKLNHPRVLQVACVLALVALSLFAWSLLQPRPILVILAMSVGQALGTLSFLLFLVVVVADLRRAQRRENESKGGAATEEAKPAAKISSG